MPGTYAPPAVELPKTIDTCGTPIAEALELGLIDRIDEEVGALPPLDPMVKELTNRAHALSRAELLLLARGLIR